MIKQGIICTVISAFHKLQFPRHPFLTDSTKKNVVIQLGDHADALMYL